MTTSLKNLIEISRHYGSDPNFVIAGGGNTSFKDDRHIWVKASGYAMSDISMTGFVQLNREGVKLTGINKYSVDPHKKEAEVKEDLLEAMVYPESGLRPSVETSLHDLIEYPYVVHTHPTLVNALMCSQQAQEKTKNLFGNDVLYVRYAPGYRLFKNISSLLEKYRKTHDMDPHLIFLQNHGIFAGANTIDEIKNLYEMVIGKISKNIQEEPVTSLAEHPDTELLLKEILAFGSDRSNAIAFRHNTLHKYFYESAERFHLVLRPFTPDIIVYCGPAYLYSHRDDLLSVLQDLKKQWQAYLKKYKKQPKIIFVKELGLVAVGDSKKSAETALDVFEDFMKISKYSRVFGGPHPMAEEEIDFVDRWEVEQYRRKIARSSGRLA